MLHNQSPWPADISSQWTTTGQACKCLVIKQSFEYNQAGEVVANPEADIISGDEYSGDPSASSLTHANEMVGAKQGFEWYGYFSAYPPKNKQAKVIEVSVNIYHQQQVAAPKKLRITGERHWKSSLLGKVASDPKPLGPEAIIYESAYGGTDLKDDEKVHTDNPSGKGYRLKSSMAKSQLLPSIELAKHIMKRPGDKAPVAGFGPIPSFWSPRLQNIVDVDQQALMVSEFPYRSDLSLDYYNYAPLDQRINIPFSQEWHVELAGVMPNLDYHQTVHLDLPYLPPEVWLMNKTTNTQITPICDTLIFDGVAQQFSLIWRVCILDSELGAATEIAILGDDNSNEDSE